LVNIQPLFSDYIPSHQIISNFFIKEHLIWKGEILWEKNNYNCKYTAWGSWKSPSNPYLKYTWEFIEIFCKGTLKHQGDRERIDISADEFKKWVVAKWSIAPERNMKQYDHPAMFPEELVERVLKLFSFQDDLILDPFNGVGTTTVVAKRLKRRYLGIDISDEYCEKANKRIKNLHNELLCIYTLRKKEWTACSSKFPRLPGLFYADGRDAMAREAMRLASLCGGMVLANAKLGAVHGIAGPLGACSRRPTARCADGCCPL